MYLRYAKQFITGALILLGLYGWQPAAAVNMQCLADLNKDGIHDARGEQAACSVATTGSGWACPLQAVACVVKKNEECPLDKSLACVNSQCRQMHSCVSQVVTHPQLGVQTKYACTQNGQLYDTADTCTSACATTAACTLISQEHICPQGNYPCNMVNGTPQCSPNTCEDLDIQPPVDTGAPPQQYESVPRDSLTGECPAGTHFSIFAGRRLSCNGRGVSTAWQDCCKDADQAMAEDIGSLAQVGLAVDAAAAVYAAASVAYLSYQAALASTGSTVAATEAATTALTNSLAASGVGIAVSVVLYLVMDYIANACKAEDFEVGMRRPAGMCIFIEEQCSKSWFRRCVQRANSYCCFNSKMARLIQEQGRKQLKVFSNWGGGGFRNPVTGAVDCRGFTPDEFQSLDFSRIDLSEYYSSLKTKAQELIQQDLTSKIGQPTTPTGTPATP